MREGQCLIPTFCVSAAGADVAIDRPMELGPAIFLLG